MDKDYWENFYNNNKDPFPPSYFAKFCLDYFPKDSHILDIGCGNGRDSVFFSEKGFRVFACDQSEVAINFLKSKYINNPYFFVSDILDLTNHHSKVNVVYARFVLHAILDSELLNLIENIYKLLPPGGLFMSESRSDKTNISEVGKNFDPHFRRLLNSENLRKSISDNNFVIDYFSEDTGFAPYKDENPFMIRLIVRK